jgi:V8-like Glu-specific endopeptidase
MAWNQTLTNLRDLLADLYFTVQDSRRVVEEAGLKPSYIAFDNRAIVNWQNILRDAQRRGKVGAIVAVAHKDYPEHPWLALARSGEIPAIRGADLQTQVEWQGLGEPDALEKIMAFSSTLLPIRFLEVGLARARSVARVVLADQTSGSGFLTTDDLLITNHHVFSSPEEARSAIVQFNYQQTAAGLDAPVETFRPEPEIAFASSRENDWTAVHVQGRPGERWGAIELASADPKVEDRVSIVQHPGGGHKQIALHHNTIVFAGETRIQYLTDTMPGSSGSPVFDQEWRVVAVHHSGGFVREPGTRKVYYRNEGIHVNALIGGLVSAGLLPENGGGAR